MNSTNKRIIKLNIKIKGNMNQIVEQVEIGVAKILKAAQNSKVFICGHSAGDF